MQFRFPAEAQTFEVSERRGAGRIERHEGTDVTYVDQTRTGGLYDWRLHMTTA